MTSTSMQATGASNVRRFRSILFVPQARTGNAAALRRLSAIALRDDASVTVLGVIEEPPALQRLLRGSDHVEAVLTASHHEMSRRLARCCRTLDGLDVTSIIDVGHPVLSAVTRATAAEHDLLVVTSDRVSDDAARIKRLVRKSPCAVWVMRPSRAVQVRVLAAIDPQPDEGALNASILEHARSIAGAQDADLHVVSAWELFGESTMQSSAFVHVDPAEIERQRRSVQAAHQRAVDELVGQHLAGVEHTVHVRAGSPHHVIHDVVRRNRINLVVMGTFGRSGITGLVMGNTAEHMLDDLACSVVAVKPPHFVSPIAE